MSAPRVVFVSHQASLTGAPMVLLHLLRWVRTHTDVRPSVIALHGGALEPALSELAPLTVVVPEDGIRGLYRLQRLLSRLPGGLGAWTVRRLQLRSALRIHRRTDLLYISSVVAADVALVARPRTRVVLHVHELEMGFRYGLPPGVTWERLVGRVDLFVAAAQCVADALRAVGVPADRVVVQHEFVDVSRLPAPAADSSPGARSDRPLVVGGCGTLEWRKGADLFVQLAVALGTLRPDVRFSWLGAGSGNARWDLEREIRAAGVGDRLELLPPTTDAASWFAGIDVFALTSREDPFPLVMLEACAAGVPVAGYDNGGVRELVTPDRGRVVPYLDLPALVGAVVELLDNPTLRRSLGAEASAVVRREHDVSVAAPRLWAAVLGPLR